MSTKWYRTTIALLITLTLSTGIAAQNLSVEKAKLADYEKQLGVQNNLQETLLESIRQKEAELNAMANQKSPEKDALEEAKKNLASNQASYDSDPTPQNKSRLSNAQFKYALVERKYKKANSKQAELSNKIARDKEQLNVTNRQIAALQKSITSQKSTISKVKSQQLAQQEKTRLQQLEEQKRATEKANQEIARLKALLEKEARAAVAIPAATNPPKGKPGGGTNISDAIQATTARPESASPQTAPKPVQTKVIPTPEVNVDKELATATKDKGYSHLTNKESVQQEEDRLSKLSKKPDNKKRRFNKILNIKTSDGNRQTNSITLKPLGHEQYRGKGKLTAGDFIFSVGFNHWEITIDSQGNYQIILDATDKKNPHFIYFRDELSVK